MKLGVQPRMDFGSVVLFALFSMGATATGAIIFQMFYEGLTSGQGLELGLIIFAPIAVLFGFLLFIHILGGALLVSLSFFLVSNFLIPVRRLTWMLFAVSGALGVYLAMMLTAPACEVELQQYGQGCYVPNGLNLALFGGSAGGLFGFIRHRMLRDPT